MPSFRLSCHLQVWRLDSPPVWRVSRWWLNNPIAKRIRAILVASVQDKLRNSASNRCQYLNQKTNCSEYTRSLHYFTGNAVPLVWRTPPHDRLPDPGAGRGLRSSPQGSKRMPILPQAQVQPAVPMQGPRHLTVRQLFWPPRDTGMPRTLANQLFIETHSTPSEDTQQ